MPIRKSKSCIEFVKTKRKPDREKKWQLRGWDTHYADQDDGIIGWAKRKSNLETKSGKKRPTCLDAEHYIPVTHTCPSIEDLCTFKQESLHSCYEQKSSSLKKVTLTKQAVSFNYTKSAPENTSKEKSDGTGDIESKTKAVQKDVDLVKHDMDVYRISKGMDSDRRGNRYFTDTRPKIDQRNTYQKIRRLLKFSTNDRRPIRSDDEEDEGYASKTSSAETKHEGAVGDESNLEHQEFLKQHNLSRSMLNLSELPSNMTGAEFNAQHLYTYRENTRFKFNYTHQPTILQLPDPDMKMVNERIQVVRRLESEDTGLSYAKLKRSKEFSRCYPQEPELPPTDASLPEIDNESDSLVSSDPVKPMTLVLRKISIQNNEHTPPPTSVTPVLWSSKDSRSTPRINSATGSNNNSARSPPGSTRSRIGSAVSRCGSAVSRASSSKSPTNLTQRAIRRSVTYSNMFGEPANMSSKNATWAQHLSLIERQATSYCIGDLLPAVDKNIYSGKLGYPPFKNDDTPRDPNGNVRASSVEDGKLLLKKGMDLLTGAVDKPTLGPPPFRPNQSRHPLMRNATVVSTRESPVPPERGKASTFRATSEKGLRPTQLADKETQRKLKEAFTQFYKNRPQDIGREFRRTQTMWRT